MSFDKQIAPLVEAIKKNKRVTFFLGAGVSTSCGIPDFRSPKTGLYANLKRLNLPYPEAVFDIDYFRENPKAFYTLAEELYPGKFLPSKFHFLLRLFYDKKLLQRVYTQNIDTLESLAGVDDEYIVAAHGSFVENHCIDCGSPMSTEDLKKHMANKGVNDGIPVCADCKGYVKPDIVFFGEGLPVRFFELWDEDIDNVEVAVVAGTSLTVYPFAGLHSDVKKNALRVLINNEVVGEFKSNKRKSDIVLKSGCDDIAEILAEKLGWKKELDALIENESKKFRSANAAEEENAEDRAEEIAKAIKAAEELKPPAQQDLKKDGAADEVAEKAASSKEDDLEERLAKLSVE